MVVQFQELESVATRPVREGLLLGSHFRAERLLHTRAGVSTWSGVELPTGRPILLKITLMSRLTSGAVERLEHEAWVLREARSPWLAPLLHCGHEGGLLYMVVPRVPGVPLSERLAHGRLSVAEALTVGRCVLGALKEVHAHGVFHGDIKPSNIIVEGRPPLERATLVDFGLAASDRLEPFLQGIPAAAVQYLSPEQAGLLDAEVAAPSDLYAVGVTLFECLAGEPPFKGGTLGELLQQHLSARPELRAMGVSVPRALDEVVQRLLQKEPRDRYQSAEAALADLNAIASGLEHGIAEPPIVAGARDRRTTVTEPSFVGRSAELEMLEGALDAAARGRGELLLLEGQSGAGKTTLLDELARWSLQRGARVFRGQSLDRVAPQPLQDLAGVLRGVLAASERDPGLALSVRERLGEQRRAVCDALPQLAGLLGHPPAESLGPEALGEERTARALALLLDSLGSAGAPALVLMDDCQWASALTLKLLADWQQEAEETSPAARYVSVIVAFRTEDVSRDHPLRRIRSAGHVTVGALGRSELRQLAVSMAGGGLPDEAVETVVKLSEGNPFMASAVVRGLVESGALRRGASGWCVVPERLAEVRSSRQAAAFLVHRLDLLPSETRYLLALGALLGRDFEVAALASLAERSPQQVVAALEEAHRRHILWEEGEGRYTFVHDRLREALLGLLPASARRALHLRAAQALERRRPERCWELAYHFDAAGEDARALPYALSAAEQARGQHALELAERYYRVAERGAREADAAVRRRIAEGLGDVLTLRGAYEEADRRFEQAIALSSSRLDRARLHGKQGEVAFKRWDRPQGREELRQALRLLGRWAPRSRALLLVSFLWELLVQVLHSRLPGWFLQRRGPSAPGAGEELLAVRLYSRLAYAGWLEREALRVPVLWAHLRELNLAERFTPTPELAQAYSEHGAALLIGSFPILSRFARVRAFLFARATRYTERSLAMRRDLGDVWGQGQSLSLRGMALYSASRFEASVEACREAARLLERTGDRWESRNARWYLCLSLAAMGKLSAALEELQRLVRLGLELEDRYTVSLGLELWAHVSGGQVPRELLEAELSRPHGEGLNYARLLDAEGARLLGAGRPGQAAVVLERILRLPRSRRARLTQHWGLCSLSMALREQATRASPPLPPSRRAALLRKAARAARRALRIPTPSREPSPRALRERGLTAGAQGRSRQARRYLDASLAVAERLGMRAERARTLLARGEVGTALGWSGAAADLAAGRAALEAVRPAARPAAAPPTLSLVDRFPRLLEAGRKIASALTREAVFAAVRESVLGLLRGEECWVIALEEGAPASDGPEPPSRTALHRALEARQPVVLSEEAAQDATESMIFTGIRAMLCAPLMVRGQPVACFFVTHRQVAGLFGDEEVRIAEFIATMAGAALENALGFAEVAALSEERRRLYQQAQEALRKRDEFLAVASHELRTPLVPLKLQLQSLLKALRNPSASGSHWDRWVARLEGANARVQRFGRLVEDLFDFSRLFQGRLSLKLEEMDLSGLTREVLERWREELGRVGSPCVARIQERVVGRWDRVRLEQVLENLLSNATKYGAGQPIEVEVAADAGWARLVVRDHGMGIAPEDQGRIFERFERAVSVEHYGGFGLGLWIAREVVQALGGRIGLESAPGKGAEFTVELPLSPSNLEERRVPAA